MAKKIVLSFFFIILICFGAFVYIKTKQPPYILGQEEVITHKKEDIVNRFKNIIKTNNPEIIAEYVQYPFVRRNPIPDIQNKEELIERYDTLLDKNIRQLILDSKTEDWEEVGYEGIMLYSGVLWIDYESKLIAINTLTEKEVDFVNDWYEKDKKNLYPDIINFYENVCIFETETYLGRIDEIKKTNDDPYSSYRLSLWNKGQSMLEKPLLIAQNGEINFYGSSDNHIYTFENNNKTYKFEVTYVGPIDLIPYRLTISQDDKILLSQEAKIIK